MARPGILLRLLLSAVATLLLLPVVWLFLPFPTLGHDTYWYPTYRMRASKTLTRVYRYVDMYLRLLGKKLMLPYSTDAFFPTYPHPETASVNHQPAPFDHPYFGLDFTMYNNILQVNNASIELRSSIASLVSHEVRTVVNARVSSPGGICPTWWPFADSAELHWQGEQAYAALPLIVRRQFDDLTHLFELLPDMSNLPANTSGAKQPTVDALIRLRWDENRMSEEYNTIEAVVADTPYSASPSHTYIIRYLMLPAITGPIKWLAETYGAVVECMFAITGQILGTAVLYIYFASVVTVFAWLGSGRPALENVLRSSNQRLRLQRIERIARRLDDLRAHEADNHGSLRIPLVLAAITGRSHRYASETRKKRLGEKVDLEKGSSLD